MEPALLISNKIDLPCWTLSQAIHVFSQIHEFSGTYLKPLLLMESQTGILDIYNAKFTGEIYQTPRNLDLSRTGPRAAVYPKRLKHPAQYNGS